MNTSQKIRRFFIWLGVAFLQLIMTQLLTFLVSLFAPDMGNFLETQPALFVVILGITFSTGVFLAGWLAIKLRWLKIEPRYVARLLGTFIGAYLPLVIALFIYNPLEAGNPFFFISTLMSLAGYYLGGLTGKK